MPRSGTGRYDHGSRNVVCDRCGRVYKSHQLRREWNGLLTCHGPGTSECWEPRHPQLDYRVRPEPPQGTRTSNPEPTVVEVTGLCDTVSRSGIANKAKAGCAICGADFVNGIFYVNPDPNAPSTPTGLAGVANGLTQIDLTWNASGDATAVTYEIYRCAGGSCTSHALIATTTSTSYSDTGLESGITYSYKIRARDSMWNRSAYTSVIEILPGYVVPGAAEYPITYNTYLERNPVVADGTSGIFSFWINTAAGTDSSTLNLYDINAQPLQVRRTGSNFIEVIGRNTSAVQILYIRSNIKVQAADGWKHVLLAWDSTTGLHQIYIDDTECLDTGVSYCNPGTFWYSRGKQRIGKATAGFHDYAGCFTEYLFDLSTYLDLSVAANRRKFITAAGAPVYLGANGEVPLASTPMGYFTGLAADFPTNLGSQTGWTLAAGTLSDCASVPS